MDNKILVKLPPDMRKALKRYSLETGTSQSAFVRRAVSRLLELETGRVIDWRMPWGGDRVKSGNGVGTTE